MSDEIGKPERSTQARVIGLFIQELGYRHLGDWTDRAGNHCIEEHPVPLNDRLGTTFCAHATSASVTNSTHSR